ncbi:MAG: thiolase family protein [Solirubrobacteraceae bacterium]
MTEALIVDAVRTPFGRHGGGLAPVRPDDLAALVLRAVLERTGVPAGDVEDVILGCGNQAGEDNRNVARMAALLAGFPEHVGGATVNRLCGSGMDAIASATRAIKLGEADAYVAGGVESMSRAPFVVPKPSRAFPTGPVEMADTTLGWRLVNPRMTELGHTDSLGQTAENLAAQHGIAREQQDAFALRSHAKAVAAQDGGRFADELVPVEVAGRKQTVTVDADEVPRRDSSLASLARLDPAFVRDGSVTAGNSSTLNDGAGAVLLTSAGYARAHGLEPLARVLSAATAGVPPRIMGIGPVPAAAKALERAGLAMDEMDLVEVDEAFAAQVLAVLREWKMDPEDDRLNVNGGAIALGHPRGASGARIVGSTVHELRRRPGARFALVSMCIGVGQGIALVLERA